MALIGTINSSNDFGLKNRIINGAMVIDQRNAGASVTQSSSSNLFVTDRWSIAGTQNAKFTGQQSSIVPVGFVNSLLLTSSAATTVSSSDFFGVITKIEGYNLADLNWGSANAKTITMSFWVRSSVTGTYTGTINNSDASRCFPFSYTISAANTFEYKTITIVGCPDGTWNTTNGTGAQVFFGLGAGSNWKQAANSWTSTLCLMATGQTDWISTNGATFYITGVQLEKGSTATSFDYRPYTTEQLLCLRYYHYLGGDTPYQSINTCVWFGTGDAVGFFRHPVEMRAIPTISKSGDWATLGSGGSAGQTVSTDQNGPKTIQWGFTGGSGGTSGQATLLRVNNNSNFRVTFSAEL